MTYRAIDWLVQEILLLFCYTSQILCALSVYVTVAVFNLDFGYEDIQWQLVWTQRNETIYGHDENSRDEARRVGAEIMLRELYSRNFSLLYVVVVVVCNGDVVQMMKKESSMTWFEEWFLYFQCEWGRESTTLTLLKDFFKMSKSTIRGILRHKLNAVLEARSGGQDS